jgi:DNA (cytosine-5)-methyltransferase 1
MLKAASFFAGIGGFDLGLERAGIEVLFQSEINSFCRKVLKKNWSEVLLKGDINEITPTDIPDEANLWCGGFPCQDLSLANQGKRKGLSGSRSGLFYTYANLIEVKKPKWVLVENVPGLLNSNQGKDFQAVLTRLDELGYGVSWRILDAKFFGTPQRRRRVYIVASLGDLSSEKVLFEQETSAFSTQESIGSQEAAARQSKKKDRVADTYVIQHAGIGRKPEAGPQAKGYRNDGEAYTLDSRGAADAVCKTTSSFRVRGPSRISKTMDGNRYRAIGNAVCVNVIEWIGKRILSVHNNQPIV